MIMQVALVILVYNYYSCGSTGHSGIYSTGHAPDLSVIVCMCVHEIIR